MFYDESKPSKCPLLHQIQKVVTTVIENRFSLDHIGWEMRNGLMCRVTDTVRVNTGESGKNSFTLGGVISC